MTLLRKLTLAGPWVQWAPVAVIAGLFAWIVANTVRETDDRVLYLRFGLLVAAMGIAFVLDDPAAVTTAATPSRLLRRRAIRLLIGALPYALIVGVLLSAGDRELEVIRHMTEPEVLPPIPSLRMALEAATLAALGVALAAMFARHRDERPGRLASVALLALFAASWTIPDRARVWIDPFSLHWVETAPWWAATLAVALLITVATSRDTRTH